MADKSIIKELESQVGGLIADHRRLVTLNSELKSQKEKLLQERRSLQEQVNSLSAELSSLRLSEALNGGGVDKSKSKARINNLMREVDRCIALLSGVDEEKRDVIDEESAPNL